MSTRPASAAVAREPLAQPSTAKAEWRRDWHLPIISGLVLMVAVIHLYSVGILIPYLVAEFGWSQKEITSGLMIVAVLGVVLAPASGMLADRIGPKPVGLFGIASYCLAVGLLSTIGSSLWMWWLIWFFIGIAYLALKPTIWVLLLSQRFSASRGLALGIALLGSSLGTAIVPKIAMELVLALGWRGAMLAMALGSALVVVPLVAFFIPHVKAARPQAANSTRAGPADPIRLVEIMDEVRSTVFLKLAIISFACSFAASALVVHIVPILHETGLPLRTAASVAALAGLGAMTGRFSYAFLLDRFDARILGAISFSIPIVACAMLGSGVSGGALMLATFLVGVASGSEQNCVSFLSSQYFRMKNFGAIFGALAGLMSMGLGLGPFTAAAVFDATGSYHMLLFWLIPAFVCTIIVVLMLPRYGR